MLKQLTRRLVISVALRFVACTHAQPVGFTAHDYTVAVQDSQVAEEIAADVAEGEQL
jgi:hypothetical protein